MSRADRATLFQQIDRLYRGGAVAALDDAQLLGRYVRDRDEAAFEALVERHGPLVLSLCRRLLRDPRDIEDAFQATFLVLAHRAGTIRDRAVLASWLYGVALRVATRCRSDVLRRRSVETSVDALEFPAADSARPIDEIGPALDQELSRLPEKYRVPIILCYFKDRTHDQAAAELSWPVGTVRSRLARGRELLRSRLTRRGWAPADAMLGLGAGAAPRYFTAQVPRALVDAAVASAGRFTGGASAVGASVAAVSSSASGSVPTLAQGVIATMAATHYTWIASGLATFGLVAGGVVAGAAALAPSGDGRPGQAAAVVAKTARSPAPSAKAAEPPPAAKAEDLATTVPDDQPSPKDVAARLAALERKLDLLLRMQSIQPTPTLPPPVSEPLRPTSPAPFPTPSIAPAPEAVPGPALPPTVPGPSVSAETISPPGAVADRPRATGASPFEPEPDALRQSSLQPPSPSHPRREAPTFEPELRSVRPPTRVTPSPSAPFDGDGDTPVLAEDESPPLRPAPRRTAPRRPVVRDDDPASVRISLPEIEAQIQIAQRKVRRNRQLLERGVISQGEAEAPLDEVRLLIARLRGMDEELTEKTSQAEATISQLNAQLERARARIAVAASITARNTRLNSRKAGMVSPEEVAKAEAEDRAARADANVIEAEIPWAGLNIQRIKERASRIRKLVEETESRFPELRLSEKTERTPS